MPATYLDEVTLKELRAMIKAEHPNHGSYAPLWHGISAFCEQEIKVQELRRTGEGAWHALVEIFEIDAGGAATQIHEFHEQCETRDQAAKRCFSYDGRRAVIVTSSVPMPGEHCCSGGITKSG